MGTYGHESWKENLLGTLPYMFNTPHTADVCIIAGNNRIYTHKIMLEINSLILDKCEGQYSTENMILEITLPSEFVFLNQEHNKIIADIIESFYTGNFTVTNLNVKFVYKFAKQYSVSCLLDYALSNIKKLLSTEAFQTEAFIENFKFAHSIDCDILMEICMGYLTSDLADKLLKSVTFLELDFSIISEITKQDTTNLAEIKLFNMVCRWFEHDPANRKTQIECLLSYIRFPFIGNGDLISSVYTWAFNLHNIDDKIKFRLLSLINTSIKMKNSASLHRRKSPFSTYNNITPLSDIDECLELIVNTVQKKGLQEQEEPDRKRQKANVLSVEQLLSVVKHKFTKAGPEIQHCIAEYISDEQMVNEETISALLQSYPIFNHELKWLVRRYITLHLHKIQVVCWEQQHISVIYVLMKGCLGRAFEFKKIECVMRWVKKHVNIVNGMAEMVTLTKVLSETVCYKCVPIEYIELIYLPYIRKLVPNLTDDTIKLSKSHVVHSEEHEVSVLARNTSRTMKVVKLPTEVYLLKPGFRKTLMDIIVSARKEKGYLSVDVQLESDELIKVTRHYSYNQSKQQEKKEFILFDKNGCMNNYPIHSSCTLTLPKLREILVKYKNLHLMVMI